MAEYGSVRQYRNRVTRMRGNHVNTAAGVHCRDCFADEYSCAECESHLLAWTDRILVYDPPWMRVSRGHPSREIVQHGLAR